MENLIKMRTLMKRPRFILIFLCFLWNYQTSWGQLNFTYTGSPMGLGITGARYNLKSADLNGDGVPDLVTSNQTANIGYAFVGDDGLLLSPASNLIASAGASGLALADFDNDGDIDIATSFITIGTSHSIAFFKNNGNGTFGGATNTNANFSVQNGGLHLLDMDYDLDGDIDLLSLSGDSNYLKVVIFENNGGGTFTPLVKQPSPVISGPLITGFTYHVAAGVFVNATQEPELIVVVGDNNVYKIKGLTNPTPTTSTIYTGLGGLDEKYKRVAIGDFNLDGATDIALASGVLGTNPNFFQILNGVGDGTFSPGFVLAPTLPISSNILDIKATDINNDSHLDIVLVASADRDIYVYTNDGNPSYGFTVSAIPQAPLGPISEVAIGDFKVDGRLDMAVVRSGAGDEAFMFHNTSSGTSDPIIDRCIQNDNSGSYLRYLSGALLTKKNDFSVEGWFRSPDVKNVGFGEEQYIFYNGAIGTDGFGLLLVSGTGELMIDASGTLMPTGLFAKDDQWHHFAVVCQSDDQWNFYLDGIEKLGVGTFGISKPSGQTIFFKDKDNTSDGTNSLRSGYLQEFRFWNVALNKRHIWAWMDIQINNSHPKYYALNSYIPMDRLNTVNTIAYDIAYSINKNALYKEVQFFPIGSLSISTDIAPVGDGGSGSLEKPVADINARIKTGIELNFDDTQPFPNGDLVISRVYDEPSDNPTTAGLIYSRVYWVFRQFGGLTTFSPLDEITIDIKDDQFQSGLYPILNTPSDPNPLAAAFKLFMRPVNSTKDTDWVLVGQGDGFGSVKARRPGSTVSEFGRELVVGVDPSVLPVRLVSFVGKKLNTETNLLEWKTAFEFENEAFEVEKSYDAKNFFKIGIVEGKSKTNQMSLYQFEDAYGLESSYYRLKQKDKSGKVNYTKSIYIASLETHTTGLKVYPNPVNSEIHLDIPLENQKQLNLGIYSIYGEKLLALQGDKEYLEKELNKNINHLPKGLYVLKITNSYKAYSTKFSKN